MKKIIVLSLILVLSTISFAQLPTLRSPDGKIELVLLVDEYVSFRILDSGKDIMSGIIKGMNGESGPIFDVGTFNRVASERVVDEDIIPEIPEKNAKIPNRYNELDLFPGREWKLRFRLYNNGWAYRFINTGEGSLQIFEEPFELAFGVGDSLLGMRESGFATAYERPYVKQALVSDNTESLFSLPALVMKKDGEKIWIGESALEDYPNLFLGTTRKGRMESRFPGFPNEENFDGNQYGWGRVNTEHNYIAVTNCPREFPWRVFGYARTDNQLLTNQLVYQLAPECRISDPSWIEPGWVILDWWARRNIHGVDFVTGSNTETAKYFIDFCADFGIRYFLFDDGWSELQDLSKVNDALNMEEVMSYANQKGVKIIMWVHWNPLRMDMEDVLDQFAEWGVAGIKVDFMNRSDQEIVKFYWDVAREAAERKMVVNFHGAYKPAGLRRAYPNVLTREGLMEFEQGGVSELPDPDLHNTLPFIRNVAGPMDFIPGTMINATRANFRPVSNMPMGKGTRAHSIAMAVIFESPMQMIPDAPNEYYNNEECARFLLEIPTVWDETLPIKSKIADHVIMARRHGETWYLAGINDWEPAVFEISLDFLPRGNFSIELIRDGINADKRAVDYVKEDIKIKSTGTIKMNMAPGGGWVGKIGRRE